MGNLATYVQARLPAQRLVELTNPDLESATILNATQLGNAETDATQEFKLLTGIDFDNTTPDPYHLACGLYGVMSKLYDYRGLPRSQGAEAARKEWLDICNKYTRVLGSLAWQSPQTNSTLQPSADPPGATLPYFDRRVLDSLVPRMPQVSGDDYNLWASNS